MIYDATLFDWLKPDMGDGYLGLPRMHAMGNSVLWGQDGDTEEMPTRFGKLFESEGGYIKDDWTVILDIEHWPEVERMAAAADAFRAAYPTRHVGHYGYAPKPDYWRAIRGKTDERYQEWRTENDERAPLAENVDTLYPSCYTFYDDPINWVRYATAQIEEAQRMGERVMPFIWFEYHNSSLLKGQQLSYDFFRLQLEVCLGLADGCVIWGGNNRTFNPDDPWVKAVTDSIR